MSAWPPHPPEAFPPPPPAPPPAAPQPAAGGASGNRFAAGIAVGLVAGLIAGLVGGFVAGRAGRDDSGASTTVSTSVSPGGSSGGSSSFSLGGPSNTTLVPPAPPTTRTDPAPVGTPVDVGNGWRVQVDGFDASPETSSEPPPGKQFVTVDLTVTYVKGEKEAESPFFGLDLSLVGDKGEEYDEMDGSCFPPDPQLDVLGDLAVGGSTSGNLCLAVPPDQLDRLVLVAEPSLNMGAAPRSYLAVD